MLVVEENSLDNTPEIVFFFQSCAAAICGRQMAALDNMCFVQVARNQMTAFWVSFVLSPAFIFYLSIFFYFFMMQSKCELQIWTNYWFHPSLAKLICERISVSVPHMWAMCWEIVLWSENGISLKEGAKGGEALLFHLAEELLSYPKLRLSVLLLPTYSTKCHLKKKISHNVAAKLLPGECACWEPDAIWKQ